MTSQGTAPGMPTPPGSETQADPAGVYQVRIKGHLGSHWADWLGGLTITLEEDGNTLLTGVVDQAALHGLLNKVRDLGMQLLSVNSVQPAQAEAAPDRAGRGAISQRKPGGNT